MVGGFEKKEGFEREKETYIYYNRRLHICFIVFPTFVTTLYGPWFVRHEWINFDILEHYFPINSIPLTFIIHLLTVFILEWKWSKIKTNGLEKIFFRSKIYFFSKCHKKSFFELLFYFFLGGLSEELRKKFLGLIRVNSNWIGLKEKVSLKNIYIACSSHWQLLPLLL